MLTHSSLYPYKCCMYIHLKIIRANVDMGVDMWSGEVCSQHSFLNTKKYTATYQRHHSIILSTEAIIHTDIYALFGHLFIVTVALMLLRGITFLLWAEPKCCTPSPQRTRPTQQHEATKVLWKALQIGKSFWVRGQRNLFKSPSTGM